MNKKEALTLAVSFLAFVVGSFTLYLNILQRAKLSLVIGETIGLFYSLSGLLLFDLDIVVQNSGARHGVLLKLTGTISPVEAPGSSTTSQAFKWYKFV